MAKAVKRRYAKIVNGKRVVFETEKWYAEFLDADGNQKRKPGYTDKAATEQMAARLEREASRDAEGMGDPHFREHRKKPLAKHLEAYLAALASKGDARNHITGTAGRVRALLDGCGFSVMDDVDVVRAREFLAKIQRPDAVADVPSADAFTVEQAAAITGLSKAGVRAAVARNNLPATGNGRARRLPRETVIAIAEKTNRGCGPGTVNGYVRAVRGFFRWMVREKRTAFNPLESLTLLNDKVDIRHARRELTAEELRLLLITAKSSAWSFRGLAGVDRFHLYLLAATTGFRANALANLTPADFDFDDHHGSVVTLAARFNKSRKPKVQPLPADVALELKAYFAGKPKGKPVWGGTWAKDKKGAHMMRHDLAAAGIPYAVDGPDGPEHADFHALRHSFLTLGGRHGIDLRTLQILAGHSRSELTERYSHRRLHDLHGAVEKLPSLLPEKTTEQATERPVKKPRSKRA